MRITASGWLLAGLISTGCTGARGVDPGGGDPMVAGDDDDGEPAVGGLPAGVAVSPGPGTSLPWNGCLEMTLGDPLPDLVASASDDTGASWALFAGTLDEVGVVLPTHAWPPGHDVEIELTWDGGAATLPYAVESLTPTLLSPAGLGVMATLGGTACPGNLLTPNLLDAVSVVLPDYAALVEVLDHDPQTGASEVRFAFSAPGSPDQHPTMATHDFTAAFDDPLLTATWIPADLPWTGFPDTVKRLWGGLQLAEDGGLPVANGMGIMAELADLEAAGLVGLCDDLAYHGAPWCGPCPYDHAETCVYAYVRDFPLAELAAPLDEIVDDGVLW